MSIISSKTVSFKKYPYQFELQTASGRLNQKNIKEDSLFGGILKETMGSGNTRPVSTGDSVSSSDQKRMEILLQRVEIRMYEHLLNMISENPETSKNIIEWTFDIFSGYSSILATDEDVSISLHNEQISDAQFNKNDYDAVIKKASDIYNVNPDLIRSVIEAESNFNSNCTSSKGAMGLMQLMPETANDLGVRNAYDPEENIMAGTLYLKGLLDRYQGNVRLALAAYNWGMGNVEKYPGKMPLETRNYVERVTASYLSEEEPKRSSLMKI
jgi:soluble lytic murein transglycosylase-like protein